MPRRFDPRSRRPSWGDASFGRPITALLRRCPWVLAGMPTCPPVSATGRGRVLRRPPPRRAVFAPVLTCEHSREDDEADECDARDNSQRQPGVDSFGHARILCPGHWRARHFARHGHSNSTATSLRLLSNRRRRIDRSKISPSAISNDHAGWAKWDRGARQSSRRTDDAPYRCPPASSVDWLPVAARGWMTWLGCQGGQPSRRAGLGEVCAERRRCEPPR